MEFVSLEVLFICSFVLVGSWWEGFVWGGGCFVLVSVCL